MNVNELISRAQSAAGNQIKYKLGSGGMSPKATLPSNINNECDCSGFVCWCLGMSRQTDHPLYVRFNQGWINTDAIVYDANNQTGFFSRIETPRPGCLIVFPKKDANSVGHVGLVTEVTDLASGNLPAKVIHCSSGNFRNFGDAVAKTDPTVFSRRSDTIYAWFEGIEDS